MKLTQKHQNFIMGSSDALDKMTMQAIKEWDY